MKTALKEEGKKEENDLEEEEKEKFYKKIPPSFFQHQEELNKLFLQMGLHVRSKTWRT